MLLDQDGNEILESMEQCISFENDDILGDINSDDIVNVLDVVMLVNIIFNGPENPNADINGDGIINILDVVTLVNIIFGN